MKYVILKADTTSRLERMVQNAITDGFEPQGGVSYSEFNRVYVQAVVKR